MKKVDVILALALASMAATCPPKDPCPGQPKPCPTPTPTPTPPPGPGIAPLKVLGNQFVTWNGKPFLGSVTTHCGWPFITKPCVDAISNAGLNATASRFVLTADERPGYEEFVRAGTAAPVPTPEAMVAALAAGPSGFGAATKLSELRMSIAAQELQKRGIRFPVVTPAFDLTRWNPAYDALLDSTAAYTLSKGIYHQFGFWDGWGAVHVNDLEMPWEAGMNVNGVAIGSCADFQQAPHAFIRARVRHHVQILGKYPHVYWEVGNEANRCSPTTAFIDGLHEAVRAAETEFGYIHHLWSPGTVEGGTLGSTFDYVSFHSTTAQPARSYPVEVNEFSPLEKGPYLAALQEARRLGTVFHYWHDDCPWGCDWEDPAWEREWTETMAAMAVVPPPIPVPEHRFPQGVPEEDYTRHTSKPKLDAQVNAVLAQLSGCTVGQPSCQHGRDPWAFLPEVTGELRKQGLWAGQHVEGKTDEIAVATSCEGEWDGDHVTTFGDPAFVVWVNIPPVPCAGSQDGGEPCIGERCGCPAVGPGAYRGGWSITPNHCTIVPPEPNACLPAPPLTKINLKEIGEARVIFDGSPNTCAPFPPGFEDWGTRCSTGLGCVPGGPEGSEQRPIVEAQWGPWKWTIDGVDCIVTAACFRNGGNPLQVVVQGPNVPHGQVIRVTGGNGRFAEAVIP